MIVVEQVALEAGITDYQCFLVMLGKKTDDLVQMMKMMLERNSSMMKMILILGTLILHLTRNNLMVLVCMEEYRYWESVGL